MLDFPLSEIELKLFELAGKEVDESDPPCQSDMIASIGAKLQSFGEDVKDHSREFVKSSYEEAKKWLDKLEPSWEEAKNDYDLERYKQDDDVVWLCESHGKKSGLEKMDTLKKKEDNIRPTSPIRKQYNDIIAAKDLELLNKDLEINNLKFEIEKLKKSNK